MPSIFVVDDDPKLLKMLQRTLTYEGLSVFTAGNGLEALSIVQSQHPDMIIVDWMMPQMDGLSFIQSLREDENETLILMLTARDAIENRVEGLESGAEDYLVKPFAPAELVARVHAMLRRVEARPGSQKASYADVTLDPSTREAKRGDETSTIPGFGLGLSIAKTLVDGMGGEIRMESELGRGSVVVMQFHSAD